jgi:hypothetical protein
MTVAEVALIITAVSSSIAAIGGAAAAIISARNGRTLGNVKQQTDGLVNMFGATKLAQGLAEGTAAGLEQGRMENKSGDA